MERWVAPVAVGRAETVTYMLDGRMRHKDNHGNEGLLTPDSVQWMTAGRGLVHSEMPEQEEGRMRGFQLWVNLPAHDKMTAPRYQEFAPERIPVAQPAPGVTVEVIAGQVGEVRGPIAQPATDPLYLDIALDAGARWAFELPAGHNAFAYLFDGEAALGGGEAARVLPAQTLAVLGGGDLLQLQAGAQGARLIVVAGRPLREPVARHGPFVMNTRQELMQAFVDFQEGRFRGRVCAPSSVSGVGANCQAAATREVVCAFRWANASGLKSLPQCTRRPAGSTL